VTRRGRRVPESTRPVKKEQNVSFVRQVKEQSNIRIGHNFPTRNRGNGEPDEKGYLLNRRKKSGNLPSIPDTRRKIKKTLRRKEDRKTVLIE